MVGGGDSAMEEATFLTKFATEGFRHSSPRHVARVEDHAGPGVRKSEDQVSSGTPSSRKLLGSKETGVTGLKLQKRQDQEVSKLEVDGFLSRSVTIPIPKSSADRSISMNAGTSRRSPIPPARTFPACLPAAMFRTRFFARRSRPPEPAAWPRSKRSAGWSIERTGRWTNGSSRWTEANGLLPTASRTILRRGRRANGAGSGNLNPEIQKARDNAPFDGFSPYGVEYVESVSHLMFLLHQIKEMGVC